MIYLFVYSLQNSYYIICYRRGMLQSFGRFLPSILSGKCCVYSTKTYTVFDWSRWEQNFFYFTIWWRQEGRQKEIVLISVEFPSKMANSEKEMEKTENKPVKQKWLDSCWHLHVLHVNRKSSIYIDFRQRETRETSGSVAWNSTSIFGRKKNQHQFNFLFLSLIICHRFLQLFLFLTFSRGYPLFLPFLPNSPVFPSSILI